MSWLSSFLHPERGYKAAQDQLNNYYNQAQQYQQPYMQHGEEAYGGMSDAMKQLLNPQALQDKWISGYKESEAAKNAEGMAQQHGLDAASSMGLMGSSPALQSIQAGTSQIGAADRQQYLDDLMKKYMSGVGIGENIYGHGANAANTSSQNAMNQGQNQAQLEYGKQNSPGDFISKIIQGGVSFATPFAQSWGMNKLGLNNNPWSTIGGR